MSNHTSTQDLIKNALEWRYATKKYDPSRKISDADWNLLTEALHLAPSSYGLQAWKFIDVRNPEIRKALRPFSWNQSQIEEASHLVVVTSMQEMTAEHIRKHILRTAEVRGQDPAALDGYRQFMETKILQEKPRASHPGWLQRQAYIAMGFLLETAALLKIDATPIEGIEPEKYDAILGLDKTSYRTSAVVALGYRHAEDAYQHAKKSRFPVSEVIEVR